MNKLNRAVVVQTKTILSGDRKRSIIDDSTVSAGLDDVTQKEIALCPGQEVYITVNKFLSFRASDTVQMVIDVGQPLDLQFINCIGTLGTVTFTNTTSNIVTATILYG